MQSITCPPFRIRAALVALVLVLNPSCKLLTTAANAPGQVASTLVGGNKPSDRVPPNVMQAGVMRFADNFSARITEATHDFAEKAGTPEARMQGMTWSIGQSTAAFTIASGPNANVAFLDLIVLVTLGRMVHEDYWMPKVWGEADRPMLEAFQALESEAWVVAGQLLTQAQQDEVRAVLKSWREQNPDMGITAMVRLPPFRDIAKSSSKDGKGMGTALGDLLSVDPLSGLEPAVAEIEQARLFGERTMFYVQRAPIVLSTQIELLGMKLMRMPEVHSALADTERISKAAESLADTAAALPESVRVEREAAVQQISDELARQRVGFITDLEKAQEPTQKILTDARATLEAGTQMSTALQGAIGALDGFLLGLREPEPPPGAPPPPEEPPGKPFDVTEYGEAASRVEAAARELHGLVSTLDQSLPEVRTVMDEAAARSASVVDHAYGRALRLGGFLIGGAALAWLAVRWISARFLAPAPRT